MKKELFRFANVSAATKIMQAQLNLELYAGEVIGISCLNDGSFAYTIEPLFHEELITGGILEKNISTDEIVEISSLNNWNLFNDFSVAQNICEMNGNNSLFQSADDKADSEKLQRYFQTVGITITVTKPVRYCSKYEKLVIQIVKQVRAGKRVIVLNQVLFDDNRSGADALGKLLSAICKQDSCGFVIISSELDALKKCCCRVYLIRNGYTAFCLEQDQFNSDYVLRFQKRQCQTYQMTNIRRESTVAPSLIEIAGCTQQGGRDVYINIKRGSIVGVLDIGNKCCGRLLTGILSNSNPDWFDFKCAYHFRKNSRRKSPIVYYNDKGKKFFFSNMPLVDNLCISAFENVSICHSLIVSNRLKRIILEEFFDELVTMGIPLNIKKTADIRFDQLNIEQQNYAAFFKLRLINPELLIIEDEPTQIDSFYCNVLESFLARGCAVLIISSSQSGLMQFCQETYAFIGGDFYGSIDKDLELFEDLSRDK